MSALPPGAARALLRPAAGAEGDDPPRVLEVDPRDGAVGVFRDTTILLRLSHAVDVDSISPDSLRLERPSGWVGLRCCVSPDGRVIVGFPGEALSHDVVHFVVVSGLRDRRGRPIATHVSRFIPGHVGWRDFSG
jgi:hypothetical protein